MIPAFTFGSVFIWTGLHIYPDVIDSRALVCPWLPMLTNSGEEPGLNAKQVKEIAGNAMHVPTIGSLLVWTVSSFELEEAGAARAEDADGGEPPCKRRR